MNKKPNSKVGNRKNSKESFGNNSAGAGEVAAATPEKSAPAGAPESKPEEKRSEKLEDPIVSPRDVNHYRIIALHNGFKAILVSTCGHALEKAEEELNNEDAQAQICIDRPDTTVFNRRRGHKRDLGEDETRKKRSRVAKSNSTTCTDTTDVEQFDKELGVGKRGLVGSMIDEMLGMSSSKKREDNEEIEIEKKSWLPEEDTSDETLLARSCKLARNNNPRIEFAINIGCGTMRDPPGMPGRSILARNYMRRLLTKPNVGLVCDTYTFNHSEYTTLKFYTKSANVQQILALVADEIKKVSISSKEKFTQDSDLLDKHQEAIQCNYCWSDPLSDWRRITLLASFAKQDHPIRNISPGDIVKLRALEDPNSKDTALSYINRYITESYVADNMTFAIKAPETLDKLDEWVTNSFNGLLTGRIGKLTGEEEPFETDEFRMFYKVYCNNSDCCDDGDSHIIITFALPPELGNDYHVKPLEYFDALISYAGPGGLSDYLRDRSLATDVITAGCKNCDESGIHINQFVSLFEIQIKLDEEGMKNMDEVIKAVFSYLKFLKDSGPFPEFYEEMKKIRRIHFHALLQEISLSDPFPIRVTKLAKWLRYFPPDETIVAPFLLFGYDEDTIKQVGTFLVPENANYMLCTCPSEYDDPDANIKIEPLFKTRYEANDITDDQLKAWQNVGPMPEFKIPQSNPFLPEGQAKFCLAKMETPDVKLYMPKGVECHPKIWYQQDNAHNFNYNHFSIYFVHVISPAAYDGPDKSAMLNVWSLMLKNILVPILHAANNADILHNIHPTHYGFMISIWSWNDKLIDVLEIVLKIIAEFGTIPREELFERKKKSLLKHMSAEFNGAYSSNYHVSHDFVETITKVDHWSTIELYQELKKSTYIHFGDFTTEFKRTCNFVALIRGNIVEDNAVKLQTIIDTHFPPNGRDPTPITAFRRRLHQLPADEKFLKFHTLGSECTDNLVFNVYQLGPPNIQTRVIVDVIYEALSRHIISKAYEIRKINGRKGANTKGKGKQKGESGSVVSENNFVMNPWIYEHQGIMTLCVIADVTSTIYDILAMNKFVDCALSSFFQDILSKWCPKDFNSAKKHVTNIYLGPGHGKKEDSFAFQHLFSELIDQCSKLMDLTFRWTDDHCKSEVLTDLTLDDVCDWYRKNLLSDGPEFRHLSIQIVGNKPSKDKPVIRNETVLERRERRRTIRNCLFNVDYKLLHNHKTLDPPTFKFTLLSEQDVDVGVARCDDDLYIMDITTFKRHLFKYPSTLNRI